VKVVINTCFGGFGLSHKAVMRYAELKGMTLYHKKSLMVNQYFTMPVDEYDRLYAECREKKNYDAINGAFFSDQRIERNDPVLIQIVEELGEESWGTYAKLKVVNIPDDTRWEIHDYDGSEHVAEYHRTWN